MWIQLSRQCVFPREQERANYVALFGYLGYLIGTPTAKYLETPTQAKAVMESLMLTELKVTDTSKVVANYFIQCIQNTPPAYVSKRFIEAGSRWMCGNEVGDGPRSYYGLFLSANADYPWQFAIPCEQSHTWIERRLWYAGFQSIDNLRFLRRLIYE